MQHCLPNLIIAGVTKGGSTSVFSYLADHPDVYASAKKEICYFMPLRFGRPLADISEYARYFRNCPPARYRMEASPGYMYGRSKLARGIQAALDNPKIIILLRDPIQRIYSFFSSHQIEFKIDQDISFHEYIQRCRSFPPEKFKEERNYTYFQLKNGCYSDYIQDWIEIFGEDLKILFFDDLKTDNLTFMRSICMWLDIDPDFYNDYRFSIENQTKGAKYKSLHKVAMQLNDRMELLLRRNMRLKKTIRSIYYYFNAAGSRAMPEFSAEDDDFLRSFYKPYNQNLRSILTAAGYSRLPAWLDASTA